MKVCILQPYITNTYIYIYTIYIFIVGLNGVHRGCLQVELCGADFNELLTCPAQGSVRLLQEPQAPKWRPKWLET